jgi:maltooligosyltrehalose synthase
MAVGERAEAETGAGETAGSVGGGAVVVSTHQTELEGVVEASTGAAPVEVEEMATVAKEAAVREVVKEEVETAAATAAATAEATAEAVREGVEKGGAARAMVEKVGAARAAVATVEGTVAVARVAVARAEETAVGWGRGWARRRCRHRATTSRADSGRRRESGWTCRWHRRRPR